MKMEGTYYLSHHKFSLPGQWKLKTNGYICNVFLFLATISLVSTATFAQLPSVYHSCSTESYSRDSVYERNLKTLIVSLVHRGPVEGFNASIVGNASKNAVYGLAQCRSDLLNKRCTECLSTASIRVIDLCPGAISARLQLDGCFIWYDNTTFLGKNLSVPGTGRQYAHCNDSERSHDDELLPNINAALSTLKAEAPLEGSFACNATGNNSKEIYWHAQCQGNFSSADCAYCLSDYVHRTRQLCNNSTRGEIYLNGCSLRYETFLFLKKSSTKSELSRGITTRESTHSHKAIALSILIAAVLVSAACLSSALIFKARKLASFENTDIEKGFEIGPYTFPYETLEHATGNFHEANMLGRGGFGEVYKGVFPDGSQVAVKKLSIATCHAKGEFLNEVKLSGCVQHRNLVKLLGCCVERGQRILVYEYMHNRSADSLLFGSGKEFFLDWEIRRDIIAGVARGLAYLHEDSQVRIVHRDIKLSNILLDGKFAPKIGDFGLALHVKDNCNGTRKVAGTVGYIPPECTMHAKLTEKVDIYSFGVMTLELISGRRNKDVGLPEDTQHLLEWAWKLCEEGRLSDLIDPALAESLDAFRDQIQLFIHVALLCAQEDADLRPSMSRVSLMIAGVEDLVNLVPDSTIAAAAAACGSGRVESLLSVESIRRTASQQRARGRVGLGERSWSGGGGAESKAVMTVSDVHPR